jgi:hypothetical protein
MTIYAVNGKEPVAAWIPSLDTSGNGTTTVNDLIGTNDCTLTSDTIWTADTSAGGVRALTFGTHTGSFSSTWNFSGDHSISFWASASVYSTGRCLLGDNTGFVHAIYPFDTTGGNGARWNFDGNKVNENGATRTGWHHFLYVRDSDTFEIFVDGVSVGSVTEAETGGSQSVMWGSYAGGAQKFTGLCDDLRFWSQALDATDVAYLYNSGNGRGRVASIFTRRQQRSQQIIK